MSMVVAFVAREPPLLPVAAAATGEVVARLGERLLRLPEERLSSLRGAGGPGVLVVLGEGGELPWVEGIVYLGQDPEAPRLLLPTALRPELPLDLFERAILARAPGASGLVAVLDCPRRLVPVGAARRIERGVLEQRMARWG